MPTEAPPPQADFALDLVPSAKLLPKDAVALMQAHQRDTIQFGQPWFLNLEQTVFGAHPGVGYAVMRRAGQVVAVLPLLVEKRRLGSTQLRSLTNYYSGLFEPTIAADMDAHQLAQLFVLLRRHYAGLGTVTLMPMDPKGRAFLLTEAAMSLALFATSRHFCFGNWYAKTTDGWSSYLAARDGKVRNTIKRARQRLAAAGARTEIITRPEDLARGTAAYQAVYDRSWKGAEPTTQFIPGLLTTCADVGALRLGLVWIGDKPVAAQLWIIKDGKAEIYKLAYDEDYKGFSPGTALSAAMFEHAIDVDGVAEIDYLMGDDPYKASWMGQRRERWGLIAYNRHSLVGTLAYHLDLIKQRIKPLLRGAKAACGALAPGAT
jgi:Acetyltransferase (GNAT) domain